MTILGDVTSWDAIVLYILRPSEPETQFDYFGPQFENPRFNKCRIFNDVKYNESNIKFLVNIDVDRYENLLKIYYVRIYS